MFLYFDAAVLYVCDINLHIFFFDLYFQSLMT